MFVAVVGIGLIAAVFFWLRLLRSWRTSPSRALWLALHYLALALALQITAVHDLLAYDLGWNLFWPTQWALVIACSLMLHVFGIRVAVTNTEQARAANRKITALTTIMGGAFLLAFALFATSPHDPDFVVGSKSRLENPGPVSVPVGMAWVVIMVPLGVSCASHAMRAHRWAAQARRDSQTWLQIGMRITEAGYLLTIVYFSHSAGYQTAEMMGWIPSWTQRSVTDPLITAAPALVFIGTVLPATGSWLTERKESAALLRRLRPIDQWLAPYISPGLKAPKSRLWRWWQRQWHPATLVYQSMIDLEDAYLRIQRELPATLSHDVVELGLQAGLDREALRSLVVAAAVATWATIPRDTDWADATIQNQAGRIIHALVEHVGHNRPHPEKPEMIGSTTPRMALTIDLDRWLRAADILGGASI